MEDVELSLGFQKLQMIPPNSEGLFEMNSMVKDLNTALEENAKHRKGIVDTNFKKQKRKSKRRRSTLPYQLPSDISASSQDEALRDHLESIATQQSDSEDAISHPNLQHGRNKKLFPQPLSLAESDSFTENCPLRPHRRKRRFKRMAVDLEPDQPVPGIHQYLQEERIKRLQSFKKPRIKPMLCGVDDTSSTLPKLYLVKQNESSQLTVLSGKRKRNMKGSSSFEVLDEENAYGNGYSPMYNTDSSISSSCDTEDTEPDDEGGEAGDDEHSDWFQESGSVCGIPSINPWWEDDDKTVANGEIMDTNLQSILNCALPHLSLAIQAKDAALPKTIRQIKRGRRRIKDRKPTYTLSRFFQDQQQWSEKQPPGSPWQPSLSHQFQDSKRPRKTPPISCSPDQETVMEGNLFRIPNANIGNKILPGVCWTQGSSLAAGELSPGKPNKDQRKD